MLSGSVTNGTPGTRGRSSFHFPGRLSLETAGGLMRTNCSPYEISSTQRNPSIPLSLLGLDPIQVKTQEENAAASVIRGRLPRHGALHSLGASRDTLMEGNTLVCRPPTRGTTSP